MRVSVAFRFGFGRLSYVFHSALDFVQEEGHVWLEPEGEELQ